MMSFSFGGEPEKSKKSRRFPGFGSPAV